MWPVSVGEVEALARAHGIAVLRVAAATDQLARGNVSWTTMCLRLPDDGAGALPLLRGIILNDDKSATYKLGLLRAVARIADTAPALGVFSADDLVILPLGLLALAWVRMYLPLVSAGLPQMPGNSGPDGLGFARQGFRALMQLGVSGQELRVGAQFTGERAVAVAQAFDEAARTVTTMPANFTRFPNSEAKVFGVERRAARWAGQALVLDRDMLQAYGSMNVPGHVWRAMQRLGPWIEPVLISEWARLIRSYAERQGQPVAQGTIEQTLTWLEPERDTALARGRALKMMSSGQPVTCVWTGKVLKPGLLDIDHCLPWSAWPCGDLWNLLPADPKINQHLKRDRLPSAAALAGAKVAIVSWWEDAWIAAPGLRDRFEREAQAALPSASSTSTEEVFSALEWRRLRLRQDQQVREWAGVRSG